MFTDGFLLVDIWLTDDGYSGYRRLRVITEGYVRGATTRGTDSPTIRSEKFFLTFVNGIQSDGLYSNYVVGT